VSIDCITIVVYDSNDLDIDEGNGGEDNVALKGW
jgi:hypothetical protein